MHEFGFLWITSRSKHPKQSKQAQDEAIFGEQNTTTRVWATKGSRPRVVKQQQFDYAYLFGTVCPATDEPEALIAPIRQSLIL